MEEPTEPEPEPVKFRATIEEPFGHVPPPAASPIERENAEPVTPCYGAPPNTPPPMPSSDLGDALPTILVGIGIAWMVGVATGAFIFSGSE